MRTLLRPAAAVLAGLALTTSLAAPADAAPADRGAGWLERQLTDGLLVNDGFPSYGASIDAALALREAGGHGPEVREIRDAVAAEVESYISYSYEFEGKQYEGDVAGATAKSLVLAQASGGDPRDFGGVNLVRRLNGLVGGDGRIADRATVDGEPDPAGDFANTIGQSFAVRGLTNADSAKARRAQRFLLAQQCSQGYFRLGFAEKSAADQTCDGGDRDTTSMPSTDVTALAVINLHATRDKTKAVRGAISDAVAWLKRQQQKNGSLDDGTPSGASNANSTGLAGWAFGQRRACGAAAKAGAWVERLQVSGDVSGTPLAGERGAIAYDRAAYTEAEQAGITDGARTQWRVATSQALPALTFLSTRQCRG